MALAGRVLIFPDLGSACSCTEGRDVLAPRGQVTRVAQAEQAGMAELLWGQHAQCQAGDSLLPGGHRMREGVQWHMRDIPDLAVPLPDRALIPGLGSNFH